MPTRSFPILRTIHASTFREARISKILNSSATSWPTAISTEGCSSMPLSLIFRLRKRNCLLTPVQMTSANRGKRAEWGQSSHSSYTAYTAETLCRRHCFLTTRPIFRHMNNFSHSSQ